MKKLGVIIAIAILLAVVIGIVIYYTQHHSMIGGHMMGPRTMSPEMMNEAIMGPSMMGTEQSDEFQKFSQGTPGANIFNANCRVCHPNGGNIINPNLPLRGSNKLADFNTFLAFIRNPSMSGGSRGSMPAFSEALISNQQTRELYQYILKML